MTYNPQIFSNYFRVEHEQNENNKKTRLALQNSHKSLHTLRDYITRRKTIKKRDRHRENILLSSGNKNNEI